MKQENVQIFLKSTLYSTEYVQDRCGAATGLLIGASVLFAYSLLISPFIIFDILAKKQNTAQYFIQAQKIVFQGRKSMRPAGTIESITYYDGLAAMPGQLVGAALGLLVGIMNGLLNIMTRQIIKLDNTKTANVSNEDFITSIKKNYHPSKRQSQSSKEVQEYLNDRNASLTLQTRRVQSYMADPRNKGKKLYNAIVTARRASVSQSSKRVAAPLPCAAHRFTLYCATPLRAKKMPSNRVEIHCKRVDPQITASDPVLPSGTKPGDHTDVKQQTPPLKVKRDSSHRPSLFKLTACRSLTWMETPPSRALQVC